MIIFALLVLSTFLCIMAGFAFFFQGQRMFIRPMIEEAYLNALKHTRPVEWYAVTLLDALGLTTLFGIMLSLIGMVYWLFPTEVEVNKSVYIILGICCLTSALISMGCRAFRYFWLKSQKFDWSWNKLEFHVSFVHSGLAFLISILAFMYR